jgi:chorismate-pyruvate lyase
MTSAALIPDVDDTPDTTRTTNPLNLDPFDLGALNPAHRLLLTSDGTITDMLHSLMGEDIVMRKLHQQGFQTPARIEPLEVPAGTWLVDRRVLLQGAVTGRTYVYATSVIALPRLESRVRAEFLDSDTPLGRIWRKHRVETFKDIIAYRQAPAGDVAGYFDVDAATLVRSRTYRLLARGVAVMLITEHFSPAIASFRSDAIDTRESHEMRRHDDTRHMPLMSRALSSGAVPRYSLRPKSSDRCSDHSTETEGPS